MTTTYNGWTNYATWKINLEYLDGYEVASHLTQNDAYYFGEELKEYVEGIIDQGDNKNAIELAFAFLSDVNWFEIASHLIADNCEA